MQCGHRYTQIADTGNHIEKAYDDDYFFAGKQGYPNYLDEKEILLKYGANYAKIIARFTKPGRLLDVGCAAGFILKGFQDAGWTCKGLEPNDRMASYGRESLKLNIVTGNLESFTTDERFDLANLVQVIGHFIDLDKAISNIAALLNKNGLVLVESWDRDSSFARLMGKHWHEYSPPTVIHWYSDESLAELFKFYGLKLIAKGRPPKKISIKHGLSVFAESTPKFPFKEKMITFLTKTIGKYNVNYPPLDLKWYLFQKI